MPPAPDPDPARRLRCGVVVRVHEQSCEVVAGGQPLVLGYLTSFPSPRTERVSPGHLVALLTTSEDPEVVAWRWYDAVILGEESGLVRLWEPFHGEVLARSRSAAAPRPPGTRAYLSAGLTGADWWVAGPVVDRAEDAEVELDEVGQFLAEHAIRG